jgi:Holliday junction resolvase
MHHLSVVDQMHLTCFRSAGSHSAVDVIALCDQYVLLLQCKKEGKRKRSYVGDIELLRAVPSPLNALRLLVIKRRGEVEWIDVDSQRSVVMSWGQFCGKD